MATIVVVVTVAVFVNKCNVVTRSSVSLFSFQLNNNIQRPRCGKAIDADLILGNEFRLTRVFGTDKEIIKT